MSGVQCMMYSMWYMCGVWYVMYSVWCIICYVWCLMSNVWCLKCNVWCVVCNICLIYDVWHVMYDVWHVMYDVWYVMYDVQCVIYDIVCNVWCGVWSAMLHSVHRQTKSYGDGRGGEECLCTSWHGMIFIHSLSFYCNDIHNFPHQYQ